MDAGKRNLGDIFNRSRILKLPHFQRHYVWEDEQWERFLDDMRYVSETNKSYFMGSIILKQQETPSTDRTGDIRSIVDGQQRLTTVALFFKALYQKNETPQRFFEIFKTYSEELILIQNYIDREVFENILLDRIDALTEEDKETRIYNCYAYFLREINKNEIEPNTLLGKVTFVGIDLHGQEDEQQIFDTINSLGVSLTTADLLKNYLFKDDVQSYNENWKEIFEKDKETREHWQKTIVSGRSKRTYMDIFLESYLFIKMQEDNVKVTSEDKKRYFKIDSIFNSYKSLINDYNVDANKIIGELKDYAKIYRENINPGIIESDFDKKNWLDRLNFIIFALDTKAIIPYILYICKYVKDPIEREKIFRYLETYLIRRIIAKSSNKNYNKLFKISLISNKIVSLNMLKDFIEKKSEKVDSVPDDDSLQKGFRESNLSNMQARGVLYLIEKTIRSDLNSTELRFINEYSLEHVLPKKWRNNWYKDKELGEAQKMELDKSLLTLGNLTLITKKLNSSISDAEWEIKKTGKAEHKGLNEYAVGIEIFSKYLSRDAWDNNVIKERTDELCDISTKNVWPLKID